MNNAQAKGAVWQKECEAKRKELKLELHDPWTGRGNIACRGLSTQLPSPNFLHETLNIRWQMLCDKYGLNSDSISIPMGWGTLCRHCSHHQDKSGSVTLLSRSLPYWHSNDRIAIPLETLTHQGWPEDLKLNTLAAPVIDWPKEFGGTLCSTKRTRRATTTAANNESALTDLVGNMMAVPNLAMVWYSTVLSVKSDMGSADPPTLDEACRVLRAGADSRARGEMAFESVVDPKGCVDDLGLPMCDFQSGEGI